MAVSSAIRHLERLRKTGQLVSWKLVCANLEHCPMVVLRFLGGAIVAAGGSSLDRALENACDEANAWCFRKGA